MRIDVIAGFIEALRAYGFEYDAEGYSYWTRGRVDFHVGAGSAEVLIYTECGPVCLEIALGAVEFEGNVIAQRVDKPSFEAQGVEFPDPAAGRPQAAGPPPF
jgi:hypothetical protein